MTMPHESAARHSRLWWCCHVLAWLVAISLLALAGLRIFYHDGTDLLACINAFTRYVYLPAYACLVWSVWRRRWRLALVVSIVVACHLKWIGPDYLRDRRFDVPPSTTATAAADSAAVAPTTLRIFFANVAGANPTPDAFLREIPEVDPDIVVFVEYYPEWHHWATTSSALRPYIYGTYPRNAASRYSGEIAVYSKLPMEVHPRIWAAKRISRAVDVLVDGVPLRLLCLHGPRPMLSAFYDYHGYWDEMVPKILALTDPAIVIGDFNATQYSAVYQRLTADRLRSAHEDRGRGFATTWPNGRLPVPPIRIDQALLSPSVECVRIVEGRGTGSDHKPLILDVQMRGRSTSR